MLLWHWLWFAVTAEIVPIAENIPTINLNPHITALARLKKHFAYNSIWQQINLWTMWQISRCIIGETLDHACISTNNKFRSLQHQHNEAQLRHAQRSFKNITCSNTNTITLIIMCSGSCVTPQLETLHQQNAHRGLQDAAVHDEEHTNTSCKELALWELPVTSRKRISVTL